jgi:predicted anti-sigma-YlaC factor YlaD
MMHLPYQEWLLEPPAEGLDPQQAAALQAHLQTCETCQALSGAWQQAERRLRLAEVVEPAPGFGERWQARLAEARQQARQRVHRRQAVLALGLSFSGALILLATLTLLAWPWLRSPNLLLWTWAYQLLSLYTLARGAGYQLLPLARAASGIMPLFVWIFLIGIMSQLALVWVVSYRLLTNPRRITK